MNKSIKIYSNACWIEGKLQSATITISGTTIAAIDFSKLQDAVDYGDAIIMPGIIDAHVHVNEPGRTDWEGFDTATQAAAAGGITTIVDMPLNASPVTTTLLAFEEKLAASKDKLHVNVGFYGGLIPGNCSEIEGLIAAGVLGIKCFLTHSGIDEFPNVRPADLYVAMPLIAKHQVPLLAHCELSTNEVFPAFEEMPTDYQNYLASRPKQWENEAIDMMIALCQQYDCSTHIVHVSSAEALRSIAEAKALGLPLTAETCPHYILFDAESIPDGATIYKCAPPIRAATNNEQLKLALADGVLDFLATDHSPAPPDLKEIASGNFKKAWGGIAGLQFLLPASFTALKDTLSIEAFIPLLTSAPARFLGVDNRKGKLAVGFDADITIWNPAASFTLNESHVFHRHRLNPYIGKQLFGIVQQTIVNGITVFHHQQIIQKNVGQWLLKK